MKHELPADAAWSVPVRAGRAITLTALADNANASVLIVGADRLDRLNIPDTLKSQMTARIHVGLVLMSDRGLALATVTESTLDWHDCLTGFLPSHLLLLELAKHGLGAADLHGGINFFTKVAVSSAAALSLVPGHATAGDSVTLRADQDLLVFVSTSAHPWATTPAGGVAVQIGTAEPGDPEGLRPEALRALELVR
ncbi:DUF1989 domain-containing protein [Kribbella antibiotica]|uniref:DUF1989 domain-containing protein n=1 Tax=Kribbella antibiotica TaxID=190195 RepID=A0A4R4Z7I8_9ACTN|nr:DUF1989 domain-containing protein [Kribbella antibiotica]TDD54158.1 DUF1989 domain-containing protein [Kribbella antibiotica]